MNATSFQTVTTASTEIPPARPTTLSPLSFDAFLFEGGTIKDNSVIQMIDMLGKIVYERQIIAGPTPYEQNFDLRNLLVEGTYAVVLMVNGKRAIHSYLVVTKPRVYTSKYLLEYLDIQKE